METEKDINEVTSNLRNLQGFDSQAFNNLLSDTSQAVTLRILARFQVSIEDAIKTIEKGLNENTSEEIWKACHKLTGSADLLGFKSFGEHSRTLDVKLKNTNALAESRTDVVKFIEAARAVSFAISASSPQLKNYL